MSSLTVDFLKAQKNPDHRYAGIFRYSIPSKIILPVNSVKVQPYNNSQHLQRILT